PADREIMARALDPNPERRFRSCGELIRALEAGLVPPEVETWEGAGRATSAELPAGIPWPPELPLRATEPGSAAPFGEILTHLLGNIAGSLEVGRHNQLHYLVYPGPSLEHRCGARLVPSSTQLKIQGFLDALRGKLVDAKPDSFTCHFYLRGSFWQE